MKEQLQLKNHLKEVRTEANLSQAQKITAKANNTLKHQLCLRDFRLDIPLPFQPSPYCDVLFCLHLRFRPWVIYFSIIATQWLVRFIKMKRKSDLVLTVLFFVLSILAFVGFVSHLLEVRI